jgi:hypothetical protein
MIFGLGRPRQGDAQVRDLEESLLAVRGSISLAITRLLAARREHDVWNKDRIIEEVIDILQRARSRSEL